MAEQQQRKPTTADLPNHASSPLENGSLLPHLGPLPPPLPSFPNEPGATHPFSRSIPPLTPQSLGSIPSSHITMPPFCPPYFSLYYPPPLLNPYNAALFAGMWGQTPAMPATAAALHPGVFPPSHGNQVFPTALPAAPLSAATSHDLASSSTAIGTSSTLSFVTQKPIHSPASKASAAKFGSGSLNPASSSLTPTPSITVRPAIVAHIVFDAGALLYATQPRPETRNSGRRRRKKARMRTASPTALRMTTLVLFKIDLRCRSSAGARASTEIDGGCS